jgi:hypothetical protein
MAINSQKLLPQAKLTSTKVNVEKKNVLLKKELINIRKTLISIDKLLLSNSLFQRKATELKRKDTERQRFKEKETRLERKKEKEITKDDKSSVPQLGIFDRINRFITFTFLGFLFNKFSKYLPQVLEFSKKIQPIAQFIESFIGNVFNGIVDFIDFGYDAHNKVSNFAKQIGGENFQKTFDDFSSNLTKFINLAIIAGMATMGGTDFGLGKRGGKPGQGGRPRVTTSGGGGAGRSNLRNPLRQRPNITGSGSSALGKFGGKFAGKVFGRIPIVGGLVSFIISVLSGEPVGRAAAKAVGFSIGSALGTFIPIPFAGTILGGILGDIVGGALYDTLVGNRPDRKKVQGRNRGGQITRGGRRVGGAVKRTVRVTKTPPKVPPAKPGESIGGKDNLQKIFPEPTGQQKGKTVNPYGFLTDTANSFLGTDIAGALGAVFIKPFLGQLPTKQDYKNFGLAMNIWIMNAMSKGLIGGNATGGFSDGGIINNGMMGDISKWAEKSIEEMIKNKVTDAINDLRKNLGLKELQESVTGRDVTTSGELAEGTIARGQVSIEQLVGLAKGAGFSQSDAVIMAAIAMAESGGNSNAHNAKPPDNSYGLWQINMIGNLGPERRQQIGISSDDKLKDPVVNAHAAKLIKNSQGFGAWTVYKTGAYKRFLPAAQAASSSSPITVYRPPTTGGFVPMGTEQGNLQSARELSSSMGLTMTSGQRGPRFPGDKSLHISGRAMDFSNVPAGTRGSAQMDKFAQEMVKKYGGSLKQLIYTPLGFGISNKQKVNLSHWGEGTNNAHYDHVHVAFKDGGSVGFDKKSKNIGPLQNFPSYDQGSTFAILPIETIVTVPIQSSSQNKIAFTGGGGGVNSNDNNRSRMFVG